jgi:hypothetical protein
MAVQSAADVVIGMRLHSVIMAAAAGVPVVALAYDPKVVNTMKALGADRMTLDLDDVGALAEKVGEAMTDSRYRSTIHAVGLVDRAGLNAKVLTDALERHQPDDDPVGREAALLALRHLEIGALLQDQEAMTRRMATLEADRDRLQGQWDHLVGSRSIKIVNSWLKLTPMRSFGVDTRENWTRFSKRTRTRRESWSTRRRLAGRHNCSSDRNRWPGRSPGWDTSRSSESTGADPKR